jgi:hypothetical protein
MPDDPVPHESNIHGLVPRSPRANDTSVLTPILLMALIIATGVLLFSITGQVPTAHG